MTSEQIKRKAIEKAVEGGWDVLPDYGDGSSLKGRDKSDAIKDLAEMWSASKIIFTPGFAKGLWGEGRKCGMCYKPENKEKPCHEKFTLQEPEWIPHQHRLLDEIQAGRDPVLYLEQFL